MPSARSAPNIAFIKYWGNRNNELRLPAAPSLSMTLSTPSVEVTVEESDAFTLHSFEQDGTQRNLTDDVTERFRRHILLMGNALNAFGAGDALPAELAVTVRSAIPPSVGLASSAAVFSAMARAAAELSAAHFSLTDEQISVLARLGSGSAARSIYGGYVALDAGEGEAIDSSHARQVAEAQHWTLHDIVIAPSLSEKPVGSSEGHAKAYTSPHFHDRIDAIRNRRLPECEDAIRNRDFEKLQTIAEEDCLDMHENVMQTQNPPLRYLSGETYRIIEDVKRLRDEEHLPVLYTMDAGPVVHLICEDAARDRIAAFAHEQEGCTVFEAQVGTGTQLLK